MSDCLVLDYLKEVRASGEKSFFTASQIALGTGLSPNGGLWRKLNNYVAKWGLLESKVILNDNNHYVRAFRIKKELVNNG